MVNHLKSGRRHALVTPRCIHATRTTLTGQCGSRSHVNASWNGGLQLEVTRVQGIHAWRRAGRD